MSYVKGRYVKIRRKQEEHEMEDRRVDKDKYERGENRRRQRDFLTLKEWRELKKSRTKRQRGDERSRQERREGANSSNKFEEDSRR